MIFIKNIKILSFSLLILFLFSCKDKKEYVNEDNIIVSFNGDYLMKKEIIKILPKNVSPQDSASIVKKYIDNWLGERLLYTKARSTIKDSGNIVKKLNDYRKQLYIYYYEENYLYNDLNLYVNDEEIEDYYNKHLENYVLATTYIKAHYLTMDASIYTYYDVLEKVRNTTLEDEEELKNYCIGTSRHAYFEKDWIEKDRFFNLINYNMNISDYELPYKLFFEFVHGDLRYIVKIDDYKLKGDYTPIELVKDGIAQIIINKRKKEKLIQEKNNLIKEAVNSGEIIIN